MATNKVTITFRVSGLAKAKAHALLISTPMIFLETLFTKKSLDDISGKWYKRSAPLIRVKPL